MADVQRIRTHHCHRLEVEHQHLATQIRHDLVDRSETFAGHRFAGHHKRGGQCLIAVLETGHAVGSNGEVRRRICRQRLRDELRRTPAIGGQLGFHLARQRKARIDLSGFAGIGEAGEGYLVGGVCNGGNQCQYAKCQAGDQHGASYGESINGRKFCRQHRCLRLGSL